MKGDIKMKKRLTVEDMTCGKCVTNVKTALQGIEGISNVDVHLSSQIVVVDGDDSVGDKDMKCAIEDAGYKVSKIEQA